MIIALDCLVIIPKCVKLWLEVGLSSKNKLWYTKIQELYDQTGESVFKSLLAYSPFTRLD